MRTLGEGFLVGSPLQEGSLHGTYLSTESVNRYVPNVVFKIGSGIDEVPCLSSRKIVVYFACKDTI